MNESKIIEMFNTTEDIHNSIDIILSETSEYSNQELLDWYDEWCMQ
jgi:hypothetical protein